MSEAWIQIYQASNNLEAHSIKGMLENELIEVRLSGESLASAAGELPAEVLQVGVWVPASQAASARRQLQRYEHGKYRDWICPRCAERNEGQFEICWQCGHDRPETYI